MCPAKLKMDVSVCSQDSLVGNFIQISPKPAKPRVKFDLNDDIGSPEPVLDAPIELPAKLERVLKRYLHV